MYALVFVNVANAQRGSNDWMTTGSDAQRTSWVRNDPKISLASMSKPGFELAWKTKFENAPRQLNGIMQPSLLDFYIGYRGFRALGFFGASSDRVIAMDTELGRLEWESKFQQGTLGTGTLNCPGGMTTAVARPTGTEYPPVPNGRGGGRGSPAKSAVGEPHEGAAILKVMAERAAAAAAAKPAPEPPKPAAAKPATAPAANPFAPRVQTVMALTSDGKLHSMYLSNGNEPKPAMSFLPANAHPQGLIAYSNTAYVTTTGHCGGADNGLWAMSLATGTVNHWKTSKDIAGSAGPAVGPDGTLYLAAGNEIVAIEHRKLEPLAIHTADSDFTSTPVVFEYKGKDLLAVTSKDGTMHLLDTAQLNRQLPYDKTRPFSTPGYDTGSITSWQDPAGTRWVLAAAGGIVASKLGFPVTNGDVKNGAIVAWKVEDEGGIPKLKPAWISRDFTSPLPPIVVNGVVFAVSSGEYRSGDAKVTAAERVKRSHPAVLYAMDALTGKELWNSGTQITSFVHSGGVAAGGSRVYVSTYDGMQYAFGFPIEH